MSYTVIDEAKQEIRLITREVLEVHNRNTKKIDLMESRLKKLTQRIKVIEDSITTIEKFKS